MCAEWVGQQPLRPLSFICGHCDKDVSSNQGYFAQHRSAYIYLCHRCGKPTFFDSELNDGSQSPSPSFGHSVQHVPDDIAKLYEEARNSLRGKANTGAILCCRKLIMNIAVSKGAAEGRTFIEYVNYLAEKGYVPPDGKEWVDHIRAKGNEATHEIKIMSIEDARELISFIEMLLKLIYEFPALIKNKMKTT